MKRLFAWYSALLMALLLSACGGEDDGAPSQPKQDISIVSLQLTPAQGTTPVGLELQFIAQATMSDGSVQDVTNEAALSWVSSDPAIATISTVDGSKGLALGVSTGSATITASGTANGTAFSATAELTVTDAVVSSLQLTPATASLPMGLEQQFIATALLSDGSSQDVTNDAALTWVSSDPAIATISNVDGSKGQAIGVSAGSTTITASGEVNGMAFSATAELTVTDVVVTSLQLTPATASVPVGLAQQFTATALLSDGSSWDMTNDAALSWTSNGPAIATISSVDGSKGLATGVSEGAVTITASGTANGTAFSATAELTVTRAVVTSLQLTPTTASLPLGLAQQFVATALLSDGSSLEVTNDAALNWVSSDPAIATISSLDGSKGLATGVSAGTVTITASGNNNGTEFSATAELVVTDVIVTSLQLTPTTASLPLGLEQQFTATAQLSDGSSRDMTNDAALSWASSDPTIATISSVDGSKGLATGEREGSVTITASGNISGTAFSATANLTVTGAVVTSLQLTPATASVPVGLEQQFIATALLSDGNSLIVTNHAALSWASSDPAIATISNVDGGKGLASGESVGPVTITASGNVHGTAFSATAELTVTSAVVTSLQLTPAAAAVAVGLEKQFTATALLSDGNSLDVTNDAALSWASSDSAIATISSVDGSKGLATGESGGSVTITASGTANGTTFNATAQLTVTSAVVTSLQVTPAAAAVSVGLEKAFTATALLSDGNSVDVTDYATLSWTSSDPAIATISSVGGSKGVATGESAGSVTITASGNVHGTAFSATAQLTVTNAVVTSLQIAPTAAAVSKGLTRQFTATALLSDGNSVDVTNQAALSWSSSDPTIATISSVDGSKGLATGEKTGTVTITASGDVHGSAFSATAQLTVTGAVVTSLQVAPTASAVSVGFERQFTATALFSDGSSQEVTDFAALTWTSSNPAIATISNVDISKGLAQGVVPGNVTITAAGTIHGSAFTATADLTVTNAVVTSLQLTPATGSVPVGLELPFTATALLSDGKSQDVTDYDTLNWISSDPTIATVSSLDGSKGIVTGVVPGSVTITASGMANGTTFTASAPLTVTSAVVTSLAVTPPTATVSVGATAQFQAMATLSDNSTLDVTHDTALTWSADNPAAAAISNVAGGKGEVTGLAEGATGIVASMAGLSSNVATLSVVPVAAPPIAITSAQNQVASMVLSPSEFAFWNSTSINTPEGQAALRDLTALVYDQFRDEFDFITVVMNNDAIPSGMPAGEYTHIKNDVAGIGLSMFDNTAAYHSDGKLQGIWFLYKKAYLSTGTYGPILHEMAHRWANWSVPSSYGGHWGPELNIVGQLTSGGVANNFADIELYLMGLMDRSEMTDPASIAAYDLIPVDQQTRVPSAATSQKEFRTLLLVLADRALTATEIQNYNNGATRLTQTDNPPSGTNFRRMTKGRGTLVVNGLDGLQK